VLSWCFVGFKSLTVVVVVVVVVVVGSPLLPVVIVVFFVLPLRSLACVCMHGGTARILVRATVEARATAVQRGRCARRRVARWTRLGGRRAATKLKAGGTQVALARRVCARNKRARKHNQGGWRRVRRGAGNAVHLSKTRHVLSRRSGGSGKREHNAC